MDWLCYYFFFVVSSRRRHTRSDRDWSADVCSSDLRSRTITMRDTPERLALAGELIQQLEGARGEVMLEIELLEVDRNKARDLGITPPASEQLIGLNANDLNKLKSSTNLTNLLTNLQQVFAGK